MDWWIGPLVYTLVILAITAVIVSQLWEIPGRMAVIFSAAAIVVAFFIWLWAITQPFPPLKDQIDAHSAEVKGTQVARQTEQAGKPTVAPSASPVPSATPAPATAAQPTTAASTTAPATAPATVAAATSPPQQARPAVTATAVPQPANVTGSGVVVQDLGLWQYGGNRPAMPAAPKHGEVIVAAGDVTNSGKCNMKVFSEGQNVSGLGDGTFRLLKVTGTDSEIQQELAKAQNSAAQGQTGGCPRIGG